MDFFSLKEYKGPKKVSCLPLHHQTISAEVDDMTSENSYYRNCFFVWSLDKKEEESILGSGWFLPKNIRVFGIPQMQMDLIDTKR